MMVEKSMNIKNGNEIEGKLIAGNDRELHTEEEFEKWKKEIEKTTGKVKAKDLIIGKKYIFECGNEAYLIAIDRIKEGNRNKPIYVFVSIGNYINIFTHNNLKEVKKMIDEDIDKTIAKVALSRYLVSSYESELGKIKNKITVYDNGKVLDNDYFKNNIFDKIIGLFISKNHKSHFSKTIWTIKNKVWDKSIKKYGSLINLKNFRVEDNVIKYDVEREVWPENEKKIISTESYIDNLFVYVLDETKISKLPKNVKIYKEEL